MDKTIKRKALISGLSLFAFVCMLCNLVQFFIAYRYNGNYSYNVCFNYPQTTLAWILIVWLIAPYFLMMLYGTKGQHKPNSKLLLTVIFALAGSYRIVYHLHMMELRNLPFDRYFDYIASGEILFMILYVLTFGAAIFGLYKMPNNKWLQLAPAICGFLYLIASTENIADTVELYFNTGMDLSFYLWLAGFIGNLLFYLVLCLNAPTARPKRVYAPAAAMPYANDQTAPIANEPTVQMGEVNLPPEKALEVLYNKLELGIITPEEYRKQRQEIIDNL